MGALTLDASAVIGLLSGTDAHHARAVAAFRSIGDRRDGLSMAASAYSEVMVHALGQGRGELVDDLIDRLGVEIVEVDRPLAREAAGLRAEHTSLRLPDALVLATARVRGARLLSFDERLVRLAADPAQS